MPRRSACPNSRTRGSAAAFAGCIGLPEPALFHPGQGGLKAFCRQFNRRFDQLAATTRPEWRAFTQAEREARTL